MPLFDLHLETPDSATFTLAYDTGTSEIAGAALDYAVFGVTPSPPRAWPAVAAVSPDCPGRKTAAARVIKISLGLACNRACGYCSQGSERAHTGATRPGDAPAFIAGLADWWDGGEDGRGGGTRFEFWGGEPLVYWKTLKYLAEAIRERWPNAAFSIITNGDLLDGEKVGWLDRVGFAVGLSHDGPGQHLRGPDPLDDPERRAVIRDLIERLGPEGRVSFNCVLTARHYSLVAAERWIADKLGLATVPMATEGLMLPYDATGMLLSPKGAEHDVIYASLLGELIEGSAYGNVSVWKATRAFAQGLADGRPVTALGQRCGMDRPAHIAVDLQGRALTCQNTAAPKHQIGEVAAIGDIRLARAHHHSLRPACRACPVVQLCQGACMFFEGALWEQACDNSFTYYTALLAGALYHMTGGGVLKAIESRDGTPIRQRSIEPEKAA
ncbi:MAG: radical SAM protein [Magnetovibrio sp.]|nr:radical SAM protein [Magnetovibrio sp.]